MAHRRFTDRQGYQWEIRPLSRQEWEFDPVGDNPNRARTARSPGYERDPYELSVEELQRLLDGSDPGSTRKVKSPFGD